MLQRSESLVENQILLPVVVARVVVVVDGGVDVDVVVVIGSLHTAYLSSFQHQVPSPS